MTYEVISASDEYVLADQVNHYISQGWICQGGVVMGSTPHNPPRFYQAMILKED